MAAGNWVDWNTGDLVTAAAFQDIQDSIVFIYADETAANAALTNKVQGTIFYDTTADVLKAWDGSAWISAETGDISAVTAGDGLSGGGTSGDVTLDLDLNELTAASVDVANDSIAIVDATDNSSKKESIADLATAMADGSTITASAGVLSAAGGGKVLQVVSATSSTAQDTTSTSYIDITGLSVTITPSSSSNDILILYTDTTRTTRTSDVSSGTVFVQLLRDATSIAEKEALMYNSAGGNGTNSLVQGEAISELDSPATTSAITYKMQMKASSSTTISSQYGNSTASIIAMEIAG